MESYELINVNFVHSCVRVAHVQLKENFTITRKQKIILQNVLTLKMLLMFKNIRIVIF